MSESEAVEAYVHARQVLANTPACYFEQPTYGFPRCQVHDGGTRTNDNVLWCDRGAREGRLRDALDTLVKNLRLEVKMGS